MIIFFNKKTKFINLVSPKKKKKDFVLQCQMHPSFISWGLILGDLKEKGTQVQNSL